MKQKDLPQNVSLSAIRLAIDAVSRFGSASFDAPFSKNRAAVKVLSLTNWASLANTVIAQELEKYADRMYLSDYQSVKKNARNS